MEDSESAGAAPPQYSQSAVTSTSTIGHLEDTQPALADIDNFFDVVPRSDATSFQTGYLGLEGFEAWIKGDVLVKLDERARGAELGEGYARCTVSLQAIESSPVQSITLYSSTQTLWESSEVAASSSSQPHVTSCSLPSTMPFSFALTSDLPHCVHLPTSSLQYRLEATLQSASSALSSTHKSILVHLTRYTAPGPISSIIDVSDDDADLQPYTWDIYTPTALALQIKRSVFRRAEPIDVRVKILPPAETLLREKGLRLRSVEANLVRVISRTEDGDKNYLMDSTRKEKGQQLEPPHTFKAESGANASGEREDIVSFESLLAHSGKHCRFHSSRPIILRLTLHPPFDSSNMPHPHPDHDAAVSGPVYGRGGGGGCESISQETLLHHVRFYVRIRVCIRGGQGEARNVDVEREIRILPGAAGGSLEGEEKRVSSAKGEKKTKGASKGIDDESFAGPSSNRGVESDSQDRFAGFDSEEEYDGYEDVGRSLSDDEEMMDEVAYRRVHDTVGSSGHDGEDTIEDHNRRLEQLRALLDGPPPSLLESRNDLQVEVDVEGVGSAMPRESHSPEGGVMRPPSFDLPLHHYGADLRGYSAREDVNEQGKSPPSLRDDWSAAAANDDHSPHISDEPPPPPPSPPDESYTFAATVGHDGLGNAAHHRAETDVSPPLRNVIGSHDSDGVAAHPPPYAARTSPARARPDELADAVPRTRINTQLSPPALHLPNEILSNSDSDPYARPPAYPYSPPSEQERHPFTSSSASTTASSSAAASGPPQYEA